MDSRFKSSLEKQISEEIRKSEDMIASDIMGSRVSEIFTEKMQSKMNEIAQITDTQVLLTNTIALLRKSVNILNDSIAEVNVSRREQQGRVNSLKDFYVKFIEIEEIVNSEVRAAQQQEEENQEFGFAEEARRAQQMRRIGQRPEKIKTIRNEES